MANALNKSKANETAACCCVDVGNIIDNDDCTVNYENLFTTELEAQNKLSELIQSAKDIESDPCKIVSVIDKTEHGFNLVAQFTFCCGAESLIFQLKLR